MNLLARAFIVFPAQRAVAFYCCATASVRGLVDSREQVKGILVSRKFEEASVHDLHGRSVGSSCKASGKGV